jgi:TRAP-type uncharacterized transport system substrate-binding protein
MTENVTARVELKPYSNKVLAVMKAKYSLKDKSEALNKFIEIYGEEVIEKEANEDYTKQIIETVDKHIKKYKSKKMTFEELDKLCAEKDV